MSLERFVEKLKATGAAYAKDNKLTENGEYCLDALNYLEADPQTSPLLQHAQLLVMLRYLINYDKDFMKESGLAKEIFAYQPFRDRIPSELIKPDDPSKVKFKAINTIGESFFISAITTSTDNFRELIGKLNLIGFNSEFNDEKITDLLRNFSFDVNNAEAIQQEQFIKDLMEIFKDSPNSSYLPLVAEAVMGFKPFNDANLPKEPDLNATPSNNDFTDWLKEIEKAISKRNQSVPKQDPGNLKYKEIENFSSGSSLKKEEASGLFSHEVSKVQKIPKDNVQTNKNKKWWYAKIAPDKLTAMREVMAQEFYRFIMPDQQKTRLAKDKLGNYFVLSEEIPGTRPFESESDIKNKLVTGSVFGLGAMLIVNLIMHETDAKPGNILIRPDGKVVKIDGDWCLSALRDPLKFKTGSEITARDIASLPIVSDYKAHHWLDVTTGGKLYAAYPQEKFEFTLFDKDFSQNVAFRKEANETALKILIMPPEMIVKFFSSYTNDQKEVGIVSNEIINRVAQLRTAMLQNKSFLSFLDSKAAVDAYVKAHEEITEFKTTKKNVLLTKDPKEAMVLMQQFSNLKKEAAQAVITMAKATPPPVPVANTAAVNATPPPLPGVRIIPPPLPANFVAKINPPPIPANFAAQANVAPVRVGPPPIPAGYVAQVQQVKAVPPPLPANNVAQAQVKSVPPPVPAQAKAVPPPIPVQAKAVPPPVPAQAKAVPPPLPVKDNKTATPAKDPAAPPPLLSEMVKNQGVKSKLQFFGQNQGNKDKAPVIEPTSPTKKSGVR
jgi:hypothetical protein